MATHTPTTDSKIEQRPERMTTLARLDELDFQSFKLRAVAIAADMVCQSIKDRTGCTTHQDENVQAVFELVHEMKVIAQRMVNAGLSEETIQ